MIRLVLLVAMMIVAVLPGFATARAREVKASLEFAPASRAALASIDVALSDPSVANADHQPVTDMALFVFKPGGDVRAALHAGNSAGPAGGGAAFSVRLFVVAGGRLYTEVRGQCGAWDNDVAHCLAACDAGDFAVRRNASVALELLIGALPGGTAGAGSGVALSACGFDEAGDAKLSVTSGKGLAVIGFDGD